MAQAGGVGDYRNSVEKYISLREIDNAGHICDTNPNLKITDHFSSLEPSQNHLIS